MATCLPRSPIDALHDVGKSFTAAINPLAGPAYACQYDGRDTVHAVQPRHRMIGYILADMTYGGGLHVLCGLPAEGKATLSENPVPPDQIGCRNCLRVLLAQARRIEVRDRLKGGIDG
jgi:hypothetical protein